MTGLRLGFMHGPGYLIQQMLKLQQFTFVCAPHPVQWAGVTAWELDLEDNRADYRRKRDLLAGLVREDFQILGGEGAFYLFLKAPWGTGSEFVAEAIRNNLLIIPGNVFSAQDTHFRVSFAASDETIREGAEILCRLARQGGPSTQP
jgi:aspartate aminotransferase/aminotransferase